MTLLNVENGNPIYDSRENCNAIIETATNRMVVASSNTTIPHSVTIIDNDAFYGCDGLTSIVIPNSITQMAHYLYRCNSLSSIIVENRNPIYDSRDNCNAIIETVTNTLIAGCKATIIPNSVTCIGDRSFWGAEELTTITIPNGVTRVEECAFCESGLTSIIIPASMDSIGEKAFCAIPLSAVTCFAVNPPKTCEYSYGPFSNVTNVPLYVPAESIDLYKVAKHWKDFKVLAIGTEDALPEILTDENTQDGKFMIDGVLYIRKDGRVYDIIGQEVH